MRHKLFALLATAGSAFASLSAQEPDGAFVRTFEVSDRIALDISSGGGSVTIRPGDSETVTVRGEIKIHENRGNRWPRWAFWRRDRSLSADNIEELIRQIESELPVDLSGNTLTVGLDGDQWNRGFYINYEIEAPRESDVQAQVGSGLLSIEGIHGQIDVQGGSGALVLREIEGSVHARTGSGSIRADRIVGDFEGRAGSGSINVIDASVGDVTVSTGSGRVTVVNVDGSLAARAGSGTITVNGKPVTGWDLSTGSGSIHLNLPPDSAFDIEARTGSGRVSTNHPLTIRGEINRHVLSGQVGGGGSLIMARTGSGGISIE